jgi:hypothetical protein
MLITYGGLSRGTGLWSYPGNYKFSTNNPVIGRTELKHIPSGEKTIIGFINSDHVGCNVRIYWNTGILDQEFVAAAGSQFQAQHR